MSVDKLRLAQRFASLKPEAQQRFIEELRTRGMDFGRLPIPARGQAETALSYAQQRLWFLWQMDPEAGLYNIPRAVRLRGKLNQAALRQTFDALVARHESLRTTFHQDGETAVQRIHAPAPFTIGVSDLTETTDPAARDGLIQSLVDAEAQAPFDLERGPLLRVRLLRLADDDHILLVTMHHIISDGWSMNVIVDEFARLYESHVAGTPARLAELPIQYADYAAWQKQWLEAGELERQLGYWKTQLGTDPVVLELPTDRPRPAVPSHHGGAVVFSLDLSLASKLRTLARQADTTLFTVLLTAFQTLLYRYTGQRELRVGVPIANRNRVETEGVVGFFVNTQVLRTEIDGTQSFASLLKQVRETMLQAQAHQELPFEQLVEALQPERSLSHNPLFQVMVNHQRRDLRALRQLPGLTLEKIERTANAAKVDLALDTQEDEAGHLDGVFGYATDLFDHATIERLQRHYVAILGQIAANPDALVGTIGLLDDSEQQQLRDWNTSDDRFRDAEPVHVAIARRAAAQPDAIAVRCGDTTLTYAGLDAAAHRVAVALRKAGVGVETVVGVALDRSPELLVRLLAVLKAGAAYLPLDPELPSHRLAHLLGDANVRLVLTSRLLSGRIPTDLPQIVMEDIDDALTGDLPPVSPHQLAYLIYTSGSTGAPKGVAVEHGPLAMHCHATAVQYGMTPGDRELHFLSFNFDGAHERWLVPLLAGSQVVLRDDELWSAEQTLDAFREHGVTNAGFPPAYLQRLAEATTPGSISMRLLSFGGEAMSRESFTRIRRTFGARTLINGYGPTEAVVTPLAWVASPEDECKAPYVPIGRPVGTRTAHVLDADLNPVPLGVTGELYIGGFGLARGYVGRPGLTAERFLPDPFSTGARMYRTGDLVRRAADGNIEYVGRLDHQVKIRGYRIEPGEIEARLRAHPAVREAVVVPHDGPGGKQLVAYVVPADPEDDPAVALKRHLEDCLPPYMVPAQCITLARLPVTGNGKLDRRALPEPVWEAQGYVAPDSDTEAVLAQVWQDVLGVERVGVTDNFFELGGDSILSIQAVSRARRAGLRFTPKDLFLHQTVQALAQVATTVQSGQAQEKPTGEVPLLPVQQAFFDTPIPSRHHWNQSVLLRPLEALDTAALDRALHAVVAHHDALRLRFTEAGGHWTQRYADDVPADLLWHEDVADTAALTAACDRAQQSLRLDTGPLLRALHLKLADGTERLFLAIHHLVVDGVSWRILLDDLQAAYRAAVQGQTIALPPRTTSYQAWAQALSTYANEEAMQQEADYWLSLPPAPPPMPDRDVVPVARDAGQASVRLDARRTTQLLQQAHAAYRTRINDLLLTAVAQAAGEWMGRPHVAVMLEGHGRESLFESVDLSRTVGWFTSVFPVVLPVSPDTGHAIKQVKETLRAVPNNGIGFGVLKQYGPAPVRAALAAMPEPRITFNYLGQFDQGSGDNPLFSLADESAGASRDAAAPLGNWITINGQVFDGELVLNLGYSTRQFDPDTIARLASALQAGLEAVIAHCLDESNQGLTPSDLVNVRIDQNALDALLDTVL